MIRLRFVALLGAFVVLLGGYATYDAFFRPTPEFVGATDAPHVAAVKALVASLPSPTGTTLDPYGTWCDSIGIVCWTSTTQQPKALIADLTRTLAGRGAKVRSHECEKPETRPIGAPDGGCVATLDYHGSRIDVWSSSRGKADNGGRDFVSLFSQMLGLPQDSGRSAAPDLHDAVGMLPAAWTAGMTCSQTTAAGCRAYGSGATAPVVGEPRTQVCAAVRAALAGRFAFEFDEDYPAAGATGPAHPYCTILAHRYRSLGHTDGESIHVVATSVDAESTTVRIGVEAES